MAGPGSVLGIVLVFAVNTGVSLLSVVTSPEHLQIAPGSSFQVTCQTEIEQPIVGCQFKIYYIALRSEGELLNASTHEGVVTKVNLHRPNTFYTAKFSNYFNKGTCLVELQGLDGELLLVGCKLTTRAEQSAVKTVAIYQTFATKLVLQESSQIVVARPGDSVNILVKRKPNLRNCWTILPNGDDVDVVQGYSYYFSNNKVLAKDPRYTLFGGRVSQGECGFTINNVRQRDNGVFFVLAQGFNEERGAKAVTFIVQELTNPVLSLDATEFVAGHNATATCSVRGALQPSDVTFTWTLGGVTLGEKQASVSALWSWPWQATVFTESFAWTLTNKHNKKNLSCHVRVFTKVGSRSKTFDSDSVTISIKTPTTTGASDSGTPRVPLGVTDVNDAVGGGVSTVSPNNSGSVSVDAGWRHEKNWFIGVAVLVSLMVIVTIVVAVVLKWRRNCKGQLVTDDTSIKNGVTWTRHRQPLDVGTGDEDHDGDDDGEVLYENVATPPKLPDKPAEYRNVPSTVGAISSRQRPKVQAKVESTSPTQAESPSIPTKKGPTQTAVREELGDEAEVSYAELRGHDSVLGRSTLPPQPEEVTYTDLDWRQ